MYYDSIYVIIISYKIFQKVEMFSLHFKTIILNAFNFFFRQFFLYNYDNFERNKLRLLVVYTLVCLWYLFVLLK